MPEHLKKIIIPTADGQRHELVVPEETDYPRMEKYAREQAEAVRAETHRSVTALSNQIQTLRQDKDILAARVTKLEDAVARLDYELHVVPLLIARLVAIGYGEEQAAEVVAGLPRAEAPAKVSLREGLSTIGYTVTETEECMEDVPELTESDIDYAREILAAWDPSTTELSYNWHGDTRIVVFPKIDTSCVTRILNAWGDCQNMRYFPLLDTSGVTYMRCPFLGDSGSQKSARLRRVPAFDYSSLTSCNGVMNSYLPELEIIPPIVFPKLKGLMNIFAGDESLTEVPPITYPENATALNGAFQGARSLGYLPLTEFGAQMTNLDSIYLYIGEYLSEPLDFSGVTLRGAAAKVRLGGLFQGCKVKELPKLEFNDVSALNNFLGWAFKTPKVIPDLSQWKSYPSLYATLCLEDTYSLERIEGLNFASVSESTWFLRASGSPSYFPNLRYIRIINLGQGSCPSYYLYHARYWGEDTPEHPDARKSLVDTLLTDSYDRAAAGLAPITVRLHPLTRARLTDEEKAAITAKGITLT